MRVGERLHSLEKTTVHTLVTTRLAEPGGNRKPGYSLQQRQQSIMSGRERHVTWLYL